MTQTSSTMEPLNFRISSALKRVIGRDLITDEFVAIFELVKNAFDARASRVDIIFDDKIMYIVDDGKGMSLADITDKWLFVAYSAKKDGTEDSFDYREKITNSQRYAGSKGVGRFSCDSLGESLIMQTKRQHDTHVEIVSVDWNRFEDDAKEEFIEVPIRHSIADAFELPKEAAEISYGTVLKIDNLRESWPKEKLLRLRSALAKIINPFADNGRPFDVYLTSRQASEVEVGNVRHDATKSNSTVNGRIENFIFDTLKDKTTHIEVYISDDGKTVYSTLTDRGALIYKISESIEPFKLLKGSEIRCNIFYLNRSAKQTFAIRMGVPSVQFGSVFLFKNGFRIFPIGEEGVDTFGIDRRKAQGYNRFLGTRDIIGRIDVSGDDEVFRESTSRDQGLIETPAYRQLQSFFDERCFRRLERYVVGVNWQDALDLDADDTSRLTGDSASARISAVVSQLVGSSGVTLIDFNRDLIRVLNERSESFDTALKALTVLATKSGDERLNEEIRHAASRFAHLQRAEASARDAADRERDARYAAERQAEQALNRAEKVELKFEEERKRNLFLTSLSGMDKDIVEILNHQIVIHASAVNEIISGQLERLRDGEIPSVDDLLSTLDNIAFQNRKILATARFATKANFRLDSETIEADLADYIKEYIEKIAPVYSDAGLSIGLKSDTGSIIRLFKPIEVAILIDNMISNADKAEASHIEFILDQPHPKELRIIIEDDGSGFDVNNIDIARIFEKGYTTSTGSGLGLFHVLQILDEMGGSISAESSDRGAKFIIRIRGR